MKLILNKYKLLLSIVISVLPSLASILMFHITSPYMGFRFTESSRNDIQNGMNKHDVWSKLGQPDDVLHIASVSLDVWTYDISRYTWFRVDFNSSSDTVVTYYVEDF